MKRAGWLLLLALAACDDGGGRPARPRHRDLAQFFDRLARAAYTDVDARPSIMAEACADLPACARSCREVVGDPADPVNAYPCIAVYVDELRGQVDDTERRKLDEATRALGLTSL